MMMKLVLITVVLCISTGISNITGFGTGTLSMPILVRFLPYDQTLLLVGIIQWFSGLWKMVGFYRHIRWDIALIFGLPAFGATIIGSLLIFIVPPPILYHIFGAFLMVYSSILILNPTFSVKRTWYTAMGGGIFYGFFAGIFGMRGPVRALLLTSYKLSKREYLATSGAIGLSADVSRIFIYSAGGVALDPVLLKGLLLFIPTTLIAAYIAQLFVEKIPQRKFEIIVAIFLAVVGLQLLIVGKPG